MLRGVVATAGPSVLLNGLSRSPVERAVWTPYCVATTAAAVHALRG